MKDLVLRNYDLFGDDLFNLFGDSMFNDNKHLMRTDIEDQGDEYLLTIEMPGFKKENIKMSLEQGYLTIEGSVESSKENKKVLSERFFGSTSRSYYVGETIMEDEIKATFDNGILSVTFPKENEKRLQEKKKYISIN